MAEKQSVSKQASKLEAEITNCIRALEHTSVAMQGQLSVLHSRLDHMKSWLEENGIKSDAKDFIVPLVGGREDKD